MATKDEQDKAPKAAEREQMEAGGSGTATVAFKGATGDAIEVTSTTWSATGPVALTPDAENPLSANLFASAPGPVTLTCVGQSDAGSATATVDIMVVDKSAPTEGEITLSLQAAPAKEKPKPAAKPEQHKTEPTKAEYGQPHQQHR